MRPARFAPIFALAFLSCADPAPPPMAVEDPEVDPLYIDFYDGKFDGAGHPIGAHVLEGDGCASATGFSLDDGIDADPAFDAPGVLCQGESDALGRGRFTVNVRAARLGACDAGCDGALFEVRALDAAGTELAARAVTGADFSETATYQNVALDLRVQSAGAVRVEVTWTGSAHARLAYVEIFRRDRQLVIEPTSGVPMAEATFRAELIDPPDDATLTVRCGELDRTDALDAAIAAGDGAIEETDFRRIVTAPMAAVVEGCALPARLVAEMRRPDRIYATSETFVMEAPIVCPDDDGRPLAIVTGFLPFPAGSSNDNSSYEAALGFDATAVPEARVLQVALPVEFDTAEALVLDLVERCDPDVVVGFGQGRYRVDLETTAYNAKDTSSVAGGFPDNRGVILDGDPIRAGGPAELASRLPIADIRAELDLAGVDVGESDDPGRYICNNLFYSLAHDAPEDRRVGFVHLPIIRRVTDADRSMLQTVVETVIRRSL